MAISISGTSGITLTGSFDSASTFGFKNRIINGAMVIDQRNAGAVVTITANPQYTLDRWFAGVTVASKFSVQQNSAAVTPPAGFIKYLGVVSLAATTPAASDNYYLEQSIEGYNIADLGFGAAGAATITISFWVRSSLTGTFGAALVNSNGNRSYPFNYTISSANTWTQITQTIPGDTTGTWFTDNLVGIRLRFGLGAGSTYQGVAGAWGTTNAVTTTTAINVVATNGATFYVTGVQLEKGSTATSFDYRPYGTELALCQRYCPVYDFTNNGDAYAGAGANATLSDYRLTYPVPVRSAGTGITTSGTFSVSNLGAGFTGATLAFQQSGLLNLGIRATTTAGSPTLSQGVGTQVYSTTTAKIIVTGCEL